MDNNDLPLKNIRVLDFTHVLAGPFCTYQLAVLGAEVIKIESPDRVDVMRFSGPDKSLAEQNMGLHYQSQAANKRAMVLNLKHAEASIVLQRLIESADVLVVNYRKSAAQKLGIDYQRVQEINPHIVYCSLTGFGLTGPKAEHPAYDNVIQAFSGLMAASGTDEQGPMRVGPPVLDYGTGAQAALAIVSSLFQRERNSRGNFIDVAMLDAAMMLMTSAVADTAKTAVAPMRVGNRSVRATYGCYTTSNGELMIGAYTQQQMVKLWQALGMQEKADIVARRDELRIDDSFDEDTQILIEVLASNSAEHWEQLLIEADVPAARVRSLDETLTEPQLQSRSVMQSPPTTDQTKSSVSDMPDKTGLSVPVSAWQSEHGSPRVTTAAPKVGEHTTEVLNELGFSPDEVKLFCQNGGCTASQ